MLRMYSAFENDPPDGQQLGLILHTLRVDMLTVVYC